jgi:hypothetical protein
MTAVVSSARRAPGRAGVRDRRERLAPSHHPGGAKMQYEEVPRTKLVGSVTSVSKDTSTAFFHVKFLKGNTRAGQLRALDERSRIRPDGER